VGVATCPTRAEAASTEGADTPEPPVAIALVAGMATALVPMVFGAIHIASASTSADPPRNVGFAVAGVGPALSPIVAHAG